jgi:hypothetical protein
LPVTVITALLSGIVGLMRRGLIVLSKLADGVFVGMPSSDHDPDDPAASEPLVVGDVLTWLRKFDFDESADFDESTDSDVPDEPASPKAEEIVSLCVEQIRGASPRLLGRNAVFASVDRRSRPVTPVQAGSLP